MLVHGRDPARGEQTLADVGAETFYRADFASLDEVRAMGERMLAEQPSLDVLVNNAGIGTTLPGDGRRIESRDGHELRFQVNYLAGYLLTSILEPLGARVVNVASAGQAAIDFDDVMSMHRYSGTRAYCQSKLAQIMHAFDLAERGITANALHPATYMPTKIVIAARGTGASTVEEGVRATLRLIGDTKVSGRYFHGEREARADDQAYDGEARRRLRELSDTLVGR